MATLKEIRKWLRGEDIEGLPPRSLAWKDDERTKRAKRRKLVEGADEFSDRIAEKSAAVVSSNQQKAKWKISSDGTDALLLFGKHNGDLVSDITKTDRAYLKWMRNQDFPEALIEIINIQLARTALLSTGGNISVHGLKENSANKKVKTLWSDDLGPSPEYEFEEVEDIDGDNILDHILDEDYE